MFGLAAATCFSLLHLFYPKLKSQLTSLTLEKRQPLHSASLFMWEQSTLTNKRLHGERGDHMTATHSAVRWSPGWKVSDTFLFSG